MSRLSKQLGGILLVSLIVLAACGTGVENSSGNGSSTKPGAYEPKGREIIAPVEIISAVNNPIDIVEVIVSDSNEHRRSYFQISGLADKTIEDKINKAIKSLFDQVIPYATGEKLPPYRGIQAVIQTDSKIDNSSVWVTPRFNCNNVLSVTAFLSVTYYHFSHGYINVSIGESLNLDLGTGKQFLLGDVFTNDSDGLSIVNDAIVNELSRRRLSSDVEYYDYAVTQVAPFKGIDYDQKFYLSDYGISIIIDHNNPEFDVGFSYTEVTVPLISAQGHIAITKRFFDEEYSIFSREATGKRFFRNYSASMSRERDSFLLNGTQWFLTTSYPDDLPQVLIDIIDVTRSQQEARIDLLTQKSTVLFAELGISSHRIGPYLNVESVIYFSDNHQGHWQQSGWVYSETGEAIRLEDIFIEGYDYQTLIRGAIENFSKVYGYQGVDPESLLTGLTFQLNDTSISFTTKPYKWSPGSIYSREFRIQYEDIGYKNLRIFD